jgi:uncharacterized protein YjiS (DUF1127 family)
VATPRAAARVDAASRIPPALAAAARRLRWRCAESRALLELWRQRYRYRRELERLLRSGPHLIDDIGLVRAHAEREAGEPFWRP